MTTDQLPKCWLKVEQAIKAGITQLILYGPPGTGKTYAGLHTNVGDGGAFRLICNEDMTSADVTGHMMPTAGGSFVWNDGAVIKAWQGNGVHGGRVVADEIDRASGDVLSLLLAMFDSPESASWTNPLTGTQYRPNQGFSVFMTTNIEDMDELPTALRDRFPVAIRIDEPHPTALASLSADLRTPARMSADSSSGRVSMRGWKAFDLARKTLGDDVAAELIFGENARSILDTLRVASA